MPDLPAGRQRGPAAFPHGAPAASWRPVRPRATNVLILLTLPAYAAAVAPFVPVRHWLVDLPACFPVQAALCLVPAALLLLLARRWRWALAHAAAGALALCAVLPGWFAARRAVRTEGAPLRVLSLNLQRESEDAAPAVLAVLRQHAPDLVFCSELTPKWQAALAPGLRDFPHRIERPSPGYFGVGLYSRLPFARAPEVIPLGYDWAPAIRAVLRAADGEVGLLGVHTPRPGTGERCAERDRALAAIPAALLPLPARHFVIGDCNATPWNRGFVELLAQTGLVNAGAAWFQPTWPAPLPFWLRLPIDHVLLGPGIGVESVVAGPDFGSDHAPLFALLRLMPPAAVTTVGGPPGGR